MDARLALEIFNNQLQQQPTNRGHFGLPKRKEIIRKKKERKYKTIRKVTMFNIKTKTF